MGRWAAYSASRGSTPACWRSSGAVSLTASATLSKIAAKKARRSSGVISSIGFGGLTATISRLPALLGWKHG